ncbi:uncharacterized protein METZ01_LOCUS25565 [marine metagenome]|uniref:Uncharacterized protein n=1 Tax=marine metagenome TaxID=408172 RepID=A0A381Q089_9ZZZZ
MAENLVANPIQINMERTPSLEAARNPK